MTTMPCIVCKKPLDDAFNGLDKNANQPYPGTAFASYGHYGSTYFDPMDGSSIEINVCDDCLRANEDLIWKSKNEAINTR